MGKSELREMKDGIEPVCHYCNSRYMFSPEDIDMLLKELEEPI